VRTPPQNAAAGTAPGLRAALVLVGLSSTVAQVVLMRELFVAAQGNELSLGLTLAMWLAWTAAGSGLLGRLLRNADPLRTLAWVQAAAAVALPCAVYLARVSPSWWNAAPGEALGPGPILLTAAVTLAIFCPLSGWLFAAGTRAWASAVRRGDSEDCNSMYLLEAAGAALGGILASALLLRSLSSPQIACVVAAVGLMSSARLLLRAGAVRIISFAAIAAACAVALLYGKRIELRSVSSAWRGYRAESTANSPYGSLAVIAGEGNRSVLQNGIVLFTVPDPPTAEEAVHFAMLEHPAPRSALLIGGGMNGSLAEILKYSSVARVDYVELDPALLSLARARFPREWAEIASSHRVHTHEMDGRLYLKSETRKFDAIIVSLPEPQTAQLNRFYTEEFFREAARRLNDGGVLAFQVHGAEEYISPWRAGLLRCLLATMQRVFPDTAVVPGETIHFLGSNSRGALTLDPQLLVQRLRQRGIATSYVSEYYLPFRMAPDRVASLREQIRATPETRINRDFAPIAYHLDVALWSTQFSAGSNAALREIAGISFRTMFIAIIALAFLPALYCARPGPANSWAHSSAGLAVALTGLSLMAVEILLLLGFQAIYGYVFDKLAVIVAAFMTGLALGTWRTMRRRDEGGMQSSLWRLLALQSVMMAAPMLVTWMLFVSSGIGIAWMWAIAHVVIPLAAVLCGVAGGMQFSIAARVWFASGGASGSSGSLYGLDLLGASAGAAVITIYLLPVCGFARTSLLIAAANLGPLLLLTMAIRRGRGISARPSSLRQTPAP
jgi:spermidine synthase